VQTLNRYILIRSEQPENTYGRFCQEILKSEGLMGFESVDLDTDCMPAMGSGDVAVVTRCFLRNSEADTLLAAAAGGAGIIFLQPQSTLVERLGFKRREGMMTRARIAIRSGRIGNGTVLQTHLPIPKYEPPATWDIMADTVEDALQPADDPAAVISSLGEGGIALFFYDVPEAVARIRFGDPDLASYSALSWNWPHAGDMYFDHVDARLAHVPQADIHCQFLAQVVSEVCSTSLPRFWYHERPEHLTTCVFESDGDWSEPEEFEELAAAVEKRDGAVTFYLANDSKVSREQADSLRSRGHTLGTHIDPLKRAEELYFSFADSFEEENAIFKEKYGERSPTLQCHRAPWMGYMDLLPLHVAHGYRLLFACLSIPVHLWARYMCGSARPMKYFDRNGVLHDCWQQPEPIMDDTTLEEKLGSHAEDACRKFDEYLGKILTTSHTPVVLLSHPSNFVKYSSSFFEYCLDRLQDKDIPIYNADEWCEFIDRRDKVRIQQEKGDAGDVYSVSHLAGCLPLMIPLCVQDRPMPQVLVNDIVVEGTILDRLSRRWLFIPLEGDGESVIRIEVRPAVAQD